MSAENPNRLNVIQSALATSREMVACGPSDEIPFSVIEGLADISIPRLEQLEIQVERTESTLDKPPHYDKLSQSVHRDLYEQLYLSAQREIKPTKDSLTFAVFLEQITDGIESLSSAKIKTAIHMTGLKNILKNRGVIINTLMGISDVYYSLPNFHKEPQELPQISDPTPDLETPAEQLAEQELPNFFSGISNNEIPQFLSQFRRGTATRAYIQYVSESIEKGVYPTDNEIKKHLLANGYTEQKYSRAQSYIKDKFKEIEYARGLDNHPVEGEQEATEPESSFKEISNDQLPKKVDFPTFTAPERSVVVVEKSIHATDDEIRYRMDSMLPIEKAAAETILERIAGNSISANDWLHAINDALPGRHIHFDNIESIIENLHEGSGFSIIRYVSQGTLYFYRRQYK